MKNRELIELLQTQDPEAEVALYWLPTGVERHFKKVCEISIYKKKEEALTECK